MNRRAGVSWVGVSITIAVIIAVVLDQVNARFSARRLTQTVESKEKDQD